MAWFFGLSIECGPREDDARALAEHFKAWPGGACQSMSPESWSCDVVPEGLSQTGVESAADAEAMTEVGHALYARLRSAPPRYRYARVGVEVFEFPTFDELCAEPDVTRLDGLVIADGMPVRSLASAFVRFAPGYLWVPWAGESYSPYEGPPWEPPVGP